MGLLNQIAGLLKPQLGQPYEGFPGQRVAPTSALTQQGMDVLGQTPQFAGGLASQGAGEIGQLLGGQSLDPIFQRGQTMFGREAEQIANKYGALDATSSSSARDAMSRALEQFTLASQAQAIPAQLQASQLGLGAIPSVSQIPQQTAQGLMAGGQVQQGQQQAIINDAMQRYMQQNTPMYSPYYSAAMNVLGLNPMENLALGQGAGLGYTGVAGILGGVGQGIGAMIGKKSDKRLKEDIETVGYIGEVRIVTWVWNEKAKKFGLEGDDIGVIADELLESHPQHVVVADGYLAVKYGDLYRDLAAA